MVSKVKVNAQTKLFYLRLESLLKEKHFDGKIDLKFLKKLVYSQFDDIIADEDEVDIGRIIGRGASSEVFFGNFRYCPCAVKKVKLSILNLKQIVSSFYPLFRLKLPFLAILTFANFSQKTDPNQ